MYHDLLDLGLLLENERHWSANPRGLRMRGTANWWVRLKSMRLLVFSTLVARGEFDMGQLATLVGSMRVSIQALTSWAPKVHRASGSGCAKLSAIVHICFFACYHGMSLKCSRFRKITFLQAHVVLKPLVSLIGRLVACSARISVDTQTQTHTLTLAAHACRGLIKVKDYNIPSLTSISSTISKF